MILPLDHFLKGPYRTYLKQCKRVSIMLQTKTIAQHRLLRIWTIWSIL